MSIAFRVEFSFKGVPKPLICYFKMTLYVGIEFK